MPLDTVTLLLSGEIPLEDFEAAVVHFHSLVRSLSKDVAGSIDLAWMIHDLEVSSALVTARGTGDVEGVERVVRAYGEVGAALESNSPIRYSQAVQMAAQKLRLVVRGKIEFMRFETAEREATIRGNGAPLGAITEAPLRQADVIRPVAPSYGAIEGRVQTLSSRGGLRFTLYDLLQDKAVSCYLKEGYEPIMREAWGKIAAVYGLVTRDPITGRALTIRQVTTVEGKAEIPRDYRLARGCAPSLSGMSPQEAIRLVRNA